MGRSRELAELGSAYDSGNSLGFRNRIINGDMRIDQRNAGASIAGNDGAFAADRWVMYHQSVSGSKGNIQQNQGSVTPPTGFINYIGFTTTSAYSVAAGDGYAFQQRIEGLNVADLGWGAASAAAVTLSFWVRSSLTGTFGGSLRNSAGNRSYPFSYTINSANTWEQKTVTIAGDTSGTWLTTNGVGIYLSFGLGVGSTYSGTAGAWNSNSNWSATGATSVVATNGATFYITGVQLEAGSVATPFERRPYGTELALCQRYFEMSYDQGTAPGANTASGAYVQVSSSTNAFGIAIFQVNKRAAPSVTWYSTTGASGNCRDDSAGVNRAMSTNRSGMYSAWGQTTTVPAGNQFGGHWTASAEL